MTSEAVRDSRPLLWTTIGTLIGICLLYAATRRVEIRQLAGIVMTVDWRWAAGVLAATVIFNALKAWRWGMLLRFAANVRLDELHAAVYAGLAANFMIAHVGEFLRTVMIAKPNGLAMSTVFASVIVERALDFIALLVILALVSVVSPNVPGIVTAAGFIIAGVVLCAVASLYWFLHPPSWFSRIVNRVRSAAPDRLTAWFEDQYARSRSGLWSIKDARLMGLAISSSVLQWVLVASAVWFSGAAVGVFPSLIGACVAFVVIVVGLSLPNSPMQIGTTQLAFVAGFGLDGTPATVSIGASLVYTAFLILPIMLIGGVVTLRGQWIRNLRLR